MFALGIACNVCNVMKEVGVNMAYGLMTNSVKEDMSKQTLDATILRLLRDIRYTLVEELYASFGATNNTHSIMLMNNHLAKTIGVPEIPDTNISAWGLPSNWKTGLEDKYWALYSAERITRWISSCINQQPRKISYQKAVEWFQKNDPVESSYDFLSEAFNLDSGKLFDRYIKWMLMKMHILTGPEVTFKLRPPPEPTEAMATEDLPPIAPTMVKNASMTEVFDHGVMTPWGETLKRHMSGLSNDQGPTSDELPPPGLEMSRHQTWSCGDSLDKRSKTERMKSRAQKRMEELLARFELTRKVWQLHHKLELQREAAARADADDTKQDTPEEKTDDQPPDQSKMEGKETRSIFLDEKTVTVPDKSSIGQRLVNDAKSAASAALSGVTTVTAGSYTVAEKVLPERVLQAPGQAVSMVVHAGGQAVSMAGRVIGAGLSKGQSALDTVTQTITTVTALPGEAYEVGKGILEQLSSNSGVLNTEEKVDAPPPYVAPPKEMTETIRIPVDLLPPEIRSRITEDQILESTYRKDGLVEVSAEIIPAEVVAKTDAAKSSEYPDIADDPDADEALAKAAKDAQKEKLDALEGNEIVG